MRDPFPGNKIPQNRFDPLAAQLIQVYQGGPGQAAAPNNGAAPGTVGYVQNNYLITQGSTSTPWNKFSVKVDYVFSDRNRSPVTMAITRKPMGPVQPDLPPFRATTQTSNTKPIRATFFEEVGLTPFSPTLLNYFYGGVNNWRQQAGNANEDQGNWKDKFCLPNVPDCNKNLTTLLFTGDNLSQWGSYSSSGSHNPLFNFNDDLTWIRGRHTVKFGATYQKNYYSGFGEQGISGGVTFDPKETGLPGVTSFTAGGGVAFASFLLGWADTGRTETFRYIGQEYVYCGWIRPGRFSCQQPLDFEPRLALGNDFVAF